MQLIQQTFTQHYDKKHNRTDHMFEQRYKAINCDKEAYLLALIRYIHQNPIRAGISDINYQWSSHKEYKTYRPKNCDTVPEELIIKNRKVINKEIKVEDLITETELLHNIKFEC